MKNKLLIFYAAPGLTVFPNAFENVFSPSKERPPILIEENFGLEKQKLYIHGGIFFLLASKLILMILISTNGTVDFPYSKLDSLLFIKI